MRDQYLRDCVHVDLNAIMFVCACILESKNLVLFHPLQVLALQVTG